MDAGKKERKNASRDASAPSIPQSSLDNQEEKKIYYLNY